jgi:uncharacterized protein YndB with AHSA1/START domain
MADRDSIEREMVVPHDRDKVWKAITDARALASWFGDIAEVDLREGGTARFGWTDHGRVFDAVVETVDPPTTFAFRWATLPDEPVDSSPNTLVTFTLHEEGAGTLIRVVETGFADLPPNLRDNALEENTSGWKAELEDLRGHLDAA